MIVWQLTSALTLKGIWSAKCPAPTIPKSSFLWEARGQPFKHNGTVIAVYVCMFCNNYTRGVCLLFFIPSHTHARNNAERQQDAERCVTFKLTMATDSLAQQTDQI